MALRDKMKKLYVTGDYYSERNRGDSFRYEEEYHERSIDPDGKIRKPTEEIEHAKQGFKDITGFVNSLPPGKVVDIGCGLGFLLSAIDEQWDKYGVEVSKFASDHASKYAKISCSDINEYYLEDEFFDVIIMNHVIEHLESPEKVVKKNIQMLKEGGWFIVSTPDFDSAAARRYQENFRLLKDETHISLFSADSLIRMLRDFDLSVRNVEFPFFNTDWFTKENLNKILDSEGVSPPFYGSVIQVFCKK